MADAYWRYGADGRVAVPVQPTASAVPVKRPRSDYPDVAGGQEFPGYVSREDDRTRLVVRDADAIGASYDRYLRNGQVASYGAGEPARPFPGSLPVHPPVEDPRMVGIGTVDTHAAGYGSGRPEMPLPPEASNTLFVEGLPADCTRREVSHIFRPFVGFREVRLVTKESRHPGGDPLVLCFVDFASPGQAAIALDALQGYKFDENDRDSANLRLQFARFPGPRSAGGPRGRR